MGNVENSFRSEHEADCVIKIFVRNGKVSILMTKNRGAPCLKSEDLEPVRIAAEDLLKR